MGSWAMCGTVSWTNGLTSFTGSSSSVADGAQHHASMAVPGVADGKMGWGWSWCGVMIGD